MCIECFRIRIHGCAEPQNVKLYAPNWQAAPPSMSYTLQVNVFLRKTFTSVEWLADANILGINTLVIEIILFLEAIFKIKPQSQDENNFLKGTLCIKEAWSSLHYVFPDCGMFLKILILLIYFRSSLNH